MYTISIENSIENPLTPPVTIRYDTIKEFNVDSKADYSYHMGTAIKHPVPDRVKPSFVFDSGAL